MKTLPALVICLTVLAAPPAHARPWRFIVTGDGRSGNNRPEDHDGVNTVIMGELASAIVAEKPSILLFSGDLIAGPKSDEEMEAQLHTWLSVMKPVYDAGIKVYPIRGNHETHVPHPDQVWRKVFSGPYALPDNGPKGEEDMSYAVDFQNALFVGIDEFESGATKVNQHWIDQVLRSNKKPHVFAFAHKMAFRSGHHADGLERDPVARDEFVRSLMGAGARAFFFGHDHLYDHRTISAPLGPPERRLEQFVIGTAGAPLVKGNDAPGNNGDWKVQQVKHIEGQYGYAVVDVDGPEVTITFKARTAPNIFQAAESFTYSLVKR